MRNELAESYEHAGVKVNIYYDREPHTPREETFGTTIVAWHRRSNLGDPGFNYGDLPRFDTPAELEQWLRDEHGALVVKPLYLYEHSGQTISLKPFSDPWDSGQVGYVFVTRKHLDDTGGEAEQMIEADVEVYDAYLRGEVYGFVVAEDEDDEESCWGFVGAIAYCKEEANATAEFINREREREADEVAYWAARDVVTL